MKVCVVGLGYIGLPTALLFARAGHDVTGTDTAAHVLTSLRDGRAHFREPGLDDILAEVRASGRFHLAARPTDADAYIICVPTPARPDRSPDLAAVAAAAKAVAAVAAPGCLVILESTVPVHATRDTVAAAMPPGILVAHCPETVLPGRMLHELVHNHRVVGGTTAEATRAAAALYRTVVEADIHETDAATAEFVKLIENTYRDVNIALSNELNLTAHTLGLDARAAIHLANLHPRVHLHAPGPGVGGHCIPVDPWFLITAAHAPLMITARAINDGMPARVAAHAMHLVDRPAPLIAVLGLAYKGGVDDVRESPSFPLIKALRQAGAHVTCHDPRLPIGQHGNTTLDDALAGADLAIIVTDHPEFVDVADRTAGMNRRLILDTRAVVRHVAGVDVRVF